MTDDRRAWQVVLEKIESDLLSGALRPGDRLPGERVLSADLGVGRSSVREALRVLEVLGLIRTATGSGPTAGAIIVATPGGGMSALMRLQVAATGFSVLDIVKTRLVLETAIAADLTAADPRPDLTASAELLRIMESEPLSAAEFLALDIQFHLSLAEASGNQVITATLAGLRDAIEGYGRTGAAQVASWEQIVKRLMREHRDILSAIESGDPDRARRVVHAHISGYIADTSLTGLAPTDIATPSTTRKGTS